MFFRNMLLALFAACVLAACGGGDYQSEPPNLTAKQAAEAYWEAPAPFNQSMYDMVVGNDETGYRVTITEGGQVLYEKTLPDFGYQAGSLADGTRIRLVSEYASADDYTPSKEVLFVGNRVFPFVFQVKHSAASRMVVMDISEGVNDDWLIIFAAEVTPYVYSDGEESVEYVPARSYWSAINRYTGAIVEFGYYDEPPPDMSAMAGRKPILGLAGVTVRRLSARSAQASR